jgi:uncharacterized protein YsxB (DUF464 family)
MTKVKVHLGKDRYFLTAEDHATGSEQVCAAVSAITLTLLGYVLNLEQAGQAEICGKRAESGLFQLNAKGGEKCRAAFEMAAQGLLQLEGSFPQYISVKNK